MAVKSQSQIRRRSTCHRHPATPVTGFCASCLRERLAGIEAAAAASGAGGVAAGNKSPSRELRRSKSCSEDFPANPCGGGDESHRRKSCDVVPRGGGSSLWNLFNRDDESKDTPRKFEAEIGNLGFDLKEEEEARVRVEAEAKTMKELIDLEWTRKKTGGGTGRDLREIAGTFWGKASGLSKKLVKWRRKPKAKKKEGNNNEEENYDGVSRRETQSEVGEYGFGGGRRSCDADPRRMSVDECRRFSFDEPRASWDGCWIGRTTTTTMARVPPMVAVVEDGGGDSSSSPGGSEQTRDYYCRGRRSFECGNSDAKVSPATTDLFYGAKLLLADADAAAADLKTPADAGVAAKKKTAPPLPIQGWGKMWSIWSGGGGKGKECPVSQKLIRSYSVSCRNEAGVGNAGLRSREDLALQKNRSVRYSPAPANADTGLLRFYLTPLRSHSHGRRSGHSRRKNVL